jgi:hypothetical protein
VQIKVEDFGVFAPTLDGSMKRVSRQEQRGNRIFFTSSRERVVNMSAHGVMKE